MLKFETAFQESETDRSGKGSILFSSDLLVGGAPLPGPSVGGVVVTWHGHVAPAYTSFLYYVVKKESHGRATRSLEVPAYTGPRGVDFWVSVYQGGARQEGGGITLNA